MSTGGATVDEDVWSRVDSTLRERAAVEEFSGSALVTLGDRTLLECAAGIADRASGAPVTPRTRFGLASLSKSFTAAAVLSCVRDGLLLTTDPVATVLPASRRPTTLPPEVTVHHLLTHTSAMGDYAEEDEDLPGYVADYGSLWHDLPVYRMERPDDYLPLYADAPPVARPGEAWHYCNAGYVLLGAVLEEVTGRPFDVAVAERVLEPVGMTGAGYLRSDQAAADVALGYLPRPTADSPWRSNLFSIPVVGSGDGGALATPRDIDRFLRAIADGSLLGAEATAAMLTPHVPVVEGITMGYGLMLREGGAFGHGGGDPGVETLARHQPSRDLSVVLLCNGEDMLDDAWSLLEEALGA